MASAAEEQELVRRTLAGDREAFRLVVLAQQGFLAELVFRQTGDRHATEDLVQETFLRAYRALPRYDARFRLSTWLARIALNVARDHGRRRRTREDALQRVSAGGESREPYAAALEREASAALGEALERLSEEQREVIVLAMWGGYTQREAAELLELPLGTVKSRQRAALAKLRDLVTPALGGDSFREAL
ncbi:MAG: RNA polymerase sigma factor [Planctomycetota bacterium]